MWWSDQEKYEKKMRLTSIQVAIDDKLNWISRLRVAFNGEWCEWRETGPRGTATSGDNPVEQPPLHIRPEETIVGATTYTYRNYGCLTSFEARLNSGRQQFWGSTKTEGRAKMKTITKRPLAYLSGGKTGGFYQLTFHWEDSAPCS